MSLNIADISGNFITNKLNNVFGNTISKATTYIDLSGNTVTKTDLSGNTIATTSDTADLEDMDCFPYDVGADEMQFMQIPMDSDNVKNATSNNLVSSFQQIFIFFIILAFCCLIVPPMYMSFFPEIKPNEVINKEKFIGIIFFIENFLFWSFILFFIFLLVNGIQYNNNLELDFSKYFICILVFIRIVCWYTRKSHIEFPVKDISFFINYYLMHIPLLQETYSTTYGITAGISVVIIWIIILTIYFLNSTYQQIYWIFGLIFVFFTIPPFCVMLINNKDFFKEIGKTVKNRSSAE